MRGVKCYSPQGPLMALTLSMNPAASRHLSLLPSRGVSGWGSSSLVSKSTELVFAAPHFPADAMGSVQGQAPRL